MSRPEGWGFPGDARRCHYIREGVSLCGRWLWTALWDERLQPDEGVSPDDCAACRRKLDAEARS